MKIRSHVAESFRLAAEATIPLAELSRVQSTADTARFGPLFRSLRDRLAALPMPRDTYATLINMVADAEALIACRELGAARWQLRQTMRRLHRLEEDWADEAGTVGGRTSRAGSPRRPADRNMLDMVEPVEA